MIELKVVVQPSASDVERPIGGFGCGIGIDGGKIQVRRALPETYDPRWIIDGARELFTDFGLGGLSARLCFDEIYSG